MNVLLVFPKPNMSFNTAHCLPLGLGYIAAVLEKEGHKVSVLDLNVQPDTLSTQVKTADIIGISATTPSIKSAWEVCRRTKSIKPNILTVIGGPHSSVLPEESLQKPQVDIVIRKEGEYTFADLCGVLEKQADLSVVKGISYKHSGTIIHNPDRSPIDNLDSLPFPAYHLFPVDSYMPTRPTNISKSLKPVSIITSRGCPYICSFCYKGVHGHKYRYRSPQNIIDEIKFLIDTYHIEYVGIQDDNFIQIPERAVEFCKLLIEEGIHIKWDTPNGIRVDQVTDEFLRYAKKSGYINVWYAIESGSQRVLDSIQKGITLPQIENAVKLAKSNGLKVGGFLCIGNYSETKEEILQTIDFANMLDLDMCQITISTPLPGSPLYNTLNSQNKLLITDWDSYGPYERKAFYEYDEMTKTDIESLYKTAYRKFYLRPSYILKSLKSPTTYTNIPIIFKDIVHFLL